MLVEQNVDLLGEWGDVVRDCAPENAIVNYIVTMSQHVAHTDDFVTIFDFFEQRFIRPLQSF